MWDQGSEGWDLGLQPRDQGSRAMGLGSANFLGRRGQAVPCLWDQLPKFAKLFNQGSEIWVQKWDQR